MAYSEQDIDEQGNVLRTRTFADDGTLTVTEANGTVSYSGQVPPGVVKAVGDYNGETNETAAAAKLKGLRAKVAADRNGQGGGINVGLNLGTINLLSGEMQNLQDLVLAMLDSQVD